MKLTTKDFNAIGTVRTLKATELKALDLTSALATIKNEVFKERLQKANILVNLSKKEIKATETLKGKQLEIERLDFLSSKVDIDNGYDTQVIRLAHNILKSAKDYQFKFALVREIEFVQTKEFLVECRYNEYSITPIGVDDNEEIILHNEKEKEQHKTTILCGFDLTGLKYMEVGETELKRAVKSDKTGSKYDKLVKLFDENPKLLDVNNIRTIEKNTDKQLKGQLSELIDSLEREQRAIELDSFIKTNKAYIPHEA